MENKNYNSGQYPPQQQEQAPPSYVIVPTVIPTVYYHPPLVVETQVSQERRSFVPNFLLFLFCGICFISGLLFLATHDSESEKAIEDLRSETMNIENKLVSVNEKAENTEATLHGFQSEFRSRTLQSKEELTEIKKR